MKDAYDRHISYIDLWRRIDWCEVGDQVLVTVLPTKGVIFFGQKGKLS